MSLQLDDRRRAMLAEMKLPFWWPQAPVGSAPALGDPSTAGAAVRAGVPARPNAPAARAEPVPRAIARTPAVVPAAPDGSAAAARIDGMDWADLRTAVLACTACALCEGRSAPVFSIDPLPGQADWLIVGEPPDQHEERAGAPFVGDAGVLLDNMLRALGCTRTGRGRAGARVTSVVKCRPGMARNPSLEELATCARHLAREIALTQPRVIVAMGRFAALSLLATEQPALLQTPLGQLRGRVHRSHGLPLVVTYPPAKLLRAPQEKAAAWADLCLARAQLLSSSNPSEPGSP